MGATFGFVLKLTQSRRAVVSLVGCDTTARHAFHAGDHVGFLDASTGMLDIEKGQPIKLMYERAATKHERAATEEDR